MNARKQKIFLLGMVIFLLVIVIVLANSSSSDNGGGFSINPLKKKDEDVSNSTNDYEYEFNETLNFETNTGSTEIASNGTDFVGFGVTNDFYDGIDYEYDEDKIYIETYAGIETISLSWLDEGYAKYVTKPDFGIHKKCILKANSFVAAYIEVEMSDVKDYIKELEKLGFNNVIKDEKDKKIGYHSYEATNGSVTVHLEYQNNYNLTIMVF